MPNEIKILPAIPNDAKGILHVLRKTWRATYPNEKLGITEEDIEESFKDSFTEENISKLQNKIRDIPENDKRLIAKTDDKIIGIARVIKNMENNKLETIYVLPEYQGKGIGKMLWEEMKNFCDPSKDIIVHVATYNQNTIEFYKKLGFEDTGKRFSDTTWRMKKIGASIPEMEMIIKANK
jgi:ribosomal protein S18 acetylase RimI-like enzyme